MTYELRQGLEANKVFDSNVVIIQYNFSAKPKERVRDSQEEDSTVCKQLGRNYFPLILIYTLQICILILISETEKAYSGKCVN